MKKTAGYSRTPLPKKLGIKDAHRVLALNAPASFVSELGPLPKGVVVRTKLAGSAAFDVILAFVKKRAEITTFAKQVRPRMDPAAGFWICWPKKASGVATDVTENDIRELLLPTGLVDNKVCAVDETWSGLRLVIRKELRGG